MAGNDSFYTKRNGKTRVQVLTHNPLGEQVQTGEKFGICLTLVLRGGLCCFEAFSMC